MALSLLDVLGYLDQIPICTAYRIDGRQTDRFPVPSLLDRAEPVWETMPGWRCDLSGARTLADLPAEACGYVSRLEQLIGVPVGMISVGPQRTAVIRGASRAA